MDQTTVKIVYSQEANKELSEKMNQKSYFINASGQNIRKIELEAIQTFYTMTKDPILDGPQRRSRRLTNSETRFFVSLKPEEITFSKLVAWLGDTVDSESGRNVHATKSQFKCNDIMVITSADYPGVKTKTETTLGRFLYNKIIIEGCGLIDVYGYINEPITDKKHGYYEALLTNALREDKVSVAQMYKYTDTRDWLGLQLHGVVTTSFTPGVLKTPTEVKKLKKELLEKYKTELENGDEKVSEMIENKLVDASMKALKGDVGLDLYISGARGSVSNNYKNINLIRGAIKNPMTGKFDIITNSLLDGLDRKDMAAHGNVIVTGGYSKAVGTKDSGYLAKELLSAAQTEVLGEEGSDCGSKGYLTVTITKKNKVDYFYRYIIEGKSLVCLTPDTIDDYIGKTVKMRSPMYCVRVGKEKHLCNKCAGDFYYKLGKKNIGLVCSRPAETLKRLGMKKFHENLIKTFPFDPNELLLK